LFIDGYKFLIQLVIICFDLSKNLAVVGRLFGLAPFGLKAAKFGEGLVVGPASRIFGFDEILK
jgi:hypothetical protein